MSAIVAKCLAPGTHWLLVCGVLWGCVKSTADSSRPAPVQRASRQVETDAAHLEQALARLLENPPDALAARRALEVIKRARHPLHRQVARVLLGLLDSSAALNQSLTVRDSEVADLIRRLEATERALADLHEKREQEQKLTHKLRDECARIGRKLEEAKKQNAHQAMEMDNLRKELEALKRIDMQRTP